jgi:hypothetical protein
MAKLDDVSNGLFRHESERAAGKLQRIDVGTYHLKQILEVTPTHDGVIRTADLG